MTPREKKLHEQLQKDLKQLKLTSILEQYSDLLDEAARKNTSMLEVLSILIGSEAAARSNEPCNVASRKHVSRDEKRWKITSSSSPRRIPKQKVLRLFDCEFVSKHQCAVLIGGTGTGKTHLLTALGYVACEKGIRVRFTRVIDMINVLTTAQINGTLEKRLREYRTTGTSPPR